MNSNSGKGWVFNTTQLRLAGYEFNDSPPSGAPARLATFEPMFPWIYVPSEDWVLFTEWFNSKYSPRLNCSNYWGYCRFQQTCSEVLGTGLIDFSLEFLVDGKRIRL